MKIVQIFVAFSEKLNFNAFVFAKNFYGSYFYPWPLQRTVFKSAVRRTDSWPVAKMTFAEIKIAQGAKYFMKSQLGYLLQPFYNSKWWEIKVERLCDSDFDHLLTIGPNGKYFRRLSHIWQFKCVKDTVFIAKSIAKSRANYDFTSQGSKNFVQCQNKNIFWDSSLEFEGPVLTGHSHPSIFGRALLKFMFSKKATKIDEIFTVDLTLTT